MRWPIGPVSLPVRAGRFSKGDSGGLTVGFGCLVDATDSSAVSLSGSTIVHNLSGASLGGGNGGNGSGGGIFNGSADAGLDHS